MKQASKTESELLYEAIENMPKEKKFFLLGLAKGIEISKTVPEDRPA